MSQPEAVLNPLQALARFGQSVWLDYIRRNMITSGELRRVIEEDGLGGVTSNPAIFEKAIAGSTDYIEALRAIERERDREAKAIYEALALADIRDAADTLRPVYDRTHRRDGYVSLEVSPYLAHDTAGTLDEARRLWASVGRDNVMIKVPATAAGVPAIQQLIGEGINVNVTLLFSLAAYEKVADAYLAGLEAFVAQGGEAGRIASVASFFISRIDSAIDQALAERLKELAAVNQLAPGSRLQATATTQDPALPEARSPQPEAQMIKNLMGKVAIANGKLTYQRYQEIVSSDRWQRLASVGAQTQRLLWASTGTKNPAYRDVLYIEELIGADTVNTIPPATFAAFRDHGVARNSLAEGLDQARETMASLDRVGVSMDAITARLLDEGVTLFVDAFDKLLGAVEKKRQAVLGSELNRQRASLPTEIAADVAASLEEWRLHGKVRRLWGCDASLWTGQDEAQWLGWLGIMDDQLAHLGHLRALAEEVKREGFSHALLLGMGGSSLGPEVLALTFGQQTGFPQMHVLDSTDPAQVKACEARIDVAETLFIVSSKSGGTLEPNIFEQYFFDRVRQVVGPDRAGSRFIAITDPGSKMQQVAEHDHFRHIFFGVPSIGGRYSALSHFGMVPAAVMGIDVARFLDQAEEMLHSCDASVPPEDNPGVVLGTVMGIAARHGRDKVTIITSPGLSDLGAWLEQLIAESTGKLGKGVIPVDGERPAEPSRYGDDRLFAYVRLDSAPDAAQDAMLDALERAGQPVVRILVPEPYALGQELFRWEIATAVAGSILGINPFDQPDVEASKIATKTLTSEYERTGALPPETPLVDRDGITLFTDAENATALAQAVGADRSILAYLRAHLARLNAGDYFALLAYVEMNDLTREHLQVVRHLVRDAKRVATCLGFGPRFLHSTGQAYKGGPNTGVFLQITCDDRVDVPVPGQRYTFGLVKAAQARGDFDVLAERKRRALRVHLGADLGEGLRTLRELVEKAVGRRAEF